jgi:hypothetical protein
MEVVAPQDADVRLPPGTAAAAAQVFRAYVGDSLAAAAIDAHQVGTSTVSTDVVGALAQGKCRWQQLLDLPLGGEPSVPGCVCIQISASSLVSAFLQRMGIGFMKGWGKGVSSYLISSCALVGLAVGEGAHYKLAVKAA